MTQYTLRLNEGGILKIPATLQKLYHLDPGDTFTLLDIGGTFVLSPQSAIVPKLAAEIEKLREEAGLSLDDLVDAARTDCEGTATATE